MEVPASIELFDANSQRVTWVRATDRATESTLLALLTALQPSGAAIQVTPSDVTVLAGVRALRIGGGGNLVVTLGGSDFTLTVNAGDQIPIRATKVKAATTATNIVALL